MKEAITRLIVAVIFMLNAILTAKGKNPLPFDENAVTGFISDVFAALSVLYVWWKNNNVTYEARLSQEYLDWLKTEKINAGGDNYIIDETEHAASDPQESEA